MIERSLVAFWVFAISGVVHALVNVKADPEIDPLLDLHFLLLNFCGGYLEFIVVQSMPKYIFRRIPSLVKQIAGFAWVWLLFYCIVLSYQWPVYYGEAVRQQGTS